MYPATLLKSPGCSLERLFRAGITAQGRITQRSAWPSIDSEEQQPVAFSLRRPAVRCMLRPCMVEYIKGTELQPVHLLLLFLSFLFSQ